MVGRTHSPSLPASPSPCRRLLQPPALRQVRSLLPQARRPRALPGGAAAGSLHPKPGPGVPRASPAHDAGARHQAPGAASPGLRRNHLTSKDSPHARCHQHRRCARRQHCPGTPRHRAPRRGCRRGTGAPALQSGGLQGLAPRNEHIGRWQVSKTRGWSLLQVLHAGVGQRAETARDGRCSFPRPFIFN